MSQNSHDDPPGLVFEDRLSGLCALELAAARGDPERVGRMIERLINALGFTIAIGSQGVMAVSAPMLEGAVAYLTEAVLDHARTGRFMAHGRPRRTPPDPH